MFRLHVAPMLGAGLVVAIALAAHAGAAAAAPETTTASPAATAPMPGTTLSPIVVESSRLDLARDSLNPATGTSSYQIPSKLILAMPRGTDVPLQKLLLQAPGVAQDSFGQIHVRGDHADVQYRINGIVVPEFISGFGGALGTHFIGNVDFLTGSLPAEYGYRTAGVVAITTKTHAANGGTADLYGGSHDTIQPSLEYGGSSGRWSYYATGSYLQSDLGIESPTPASDPIHDHTEQNRAFGYLSYLLSDNAQIGAMVGHYLGNFQIPNNPGQPAQYGYEGYTPEQLTTLYPSAGLNETQREIGDYGIAFLQGYTGRLNYQVALFSSYSSVKYNPDPIGDLIYDGVAAQVFRRSIANGVQEDTSYQLDASHTLRWGLFAERESTTSENTSAVFHADSQGNQTSDVPFTVVDNGGITGELYGVYLQDQWNVVPAFTLNYGLRYDISSGYVREEQLSPRLNFVWQVTDSTAIHGGYSRYFTPPTLELITPTDIAKFKNTTNRLPSDVNTNVSAERDDYYDIGITQSVDSRWKLGLDGYYKNATDLLDEGQFGQALVFSPFNYAKGRVWGIEFSTSYQGDSVSTYFNVAYSRALGHEVASGQYNFSPEELDYIATHWVHLDHDQTWTASGGVDYDLRGTHLTLDGIFGSGLRSGFANTKSLPSYASLNLGTWREFRAAGIGAFRARFVIVNVLDRVYQIRNGSGIGVGAPQYGERRGFYVGLTKSF